MPIAATDYNHVRLTVTDIARSRAFYDSVFGFEVAHEMPENPDEETKKALGFLFGGVIYKFGGGLFGLRPVAEDTFSEDRTGLDHVCFSLGSTAELEDAVKTLDGLGVEHEEIKDIGDANILEFRDPDGIALELIAPKG